VLHAYINFVVVKNVSGHAKMT